MKKTLLLLPLMLSAHIAYAASCQSSTLFNAAYAGNRAGIEQYAKNKCRLDVKDARGLTLYDIAALQGNENLMNWLVSQNAAKNGRFSPALIRLLQTGLRYIGYDAGSFTGSMNNTTLNAIKRYQKSLGQKSTGSINIAWLPHFVQAVTKKAQQDLTRMGYNTGRADGRLGGGTQSAMKKFRSQNKMAVPSYGYIDDQLIYQLMAGKHADSKAKQQAQAKAKAQQEAERKRQAALAEQRAAAQRAAQERANTERERQQALAQQQVQIQAPPAAAAAPVIAAPAVQTVTAETSRQPDLIARPVQQVQPVQSAQPITVQAESPSRAQAQQQAAQQAEAERARQAQLAAQQAEAERARQAQLQAQQQAEAERARQAQLAAQKAAADQAELQRKMDALVAKQREQQAQTQFNSVQPANAAPAAISRTASAIPPGAVGGVSVNKKFNKLSGTLIFNGGENNCTVGGQKIDSSWCRTYYPSGANKQCDAVISKTGVVVSMRCK